MKYIDTTNWSEWLTDDRLSRMNHYRFRANAAELSRNEALALIQKMPPLGRQELQELIG